MYIVMSTNWNIHLHVMMYNKEQAPTKKPPVDTLQWHTAWLTALLWSRAVRDRKKRKKESGLWTILFHKYHYFILRISSHFTFLHFPRKKTCNGCRLCSLWLWMWIQLVHLSRDDVDLADAGMISKTFLHFLVQIPNVANDTYTVNQQWVKRCL